MFPHQLTLFVFFQHLEKSSEESGETERLKQLVSENSSLKERTSELQNQLQRLLEKLKNEKEKVRRYKHIQPRIGCPIAEVVLFSF